MKLVRSDIVRINFAVTFVLYSTSESRFWSGSRLTVHDISLVRYQALRLSSTDRSSDLLLVAFWILQVCRGQEVDRAKVASITDPDSISYTPILRGRDVYLVSAPASRRLSTKGISVVK